MKRFLSIILTLCMLLSMFTVLTATGSATDNALTADKAWYTDHTTDTDLYIGTPAELLGFAELLATQVMANNDNSDLTTVDASMKIFYGKTIHLTADIDMNPGWTASATAPTNVWPNVAYHCFTGMFNGEGHTISGIYFSSTSANHTGIFGNLKGGTSDAPVGVKNLAIVNSYLTTPNNNFGGLFGAVPESEREKNGQYLIENVYLDIEQMIGYKKNANVDWNSNTGGMIGYLSAGNTVTIRNSIVAGTLTSNGNDRPVGGYVGMCYGNVLFENCLFSGIWKSNNNTCSGFIAQTAGSGKATINHCIEAGDIYPAGWTADMNGHGSFFGYSSGKGSIVSNSIYTDVFYAVSGNYVVDNRLCGDNSSDKLNTETNNINNTYVPDDDIFGTGIAKTLEKAGMTDWTVTTSMPIPTTILKTFGKLLAKENIKPVTSLAGYQVSDTADGKYNARLVATLNLPEGKTLADFTAVGFKVTATFGTESKNVTKTTANVYSSVAGYTKGTATVSAYTAENLGGDYLFVLPIIGIPTSAGNVTLKVTTFCTTADGNISSYEQSFTIDTAKTELP